MRWDSHKEPEYKTDPAIIPAYGVTDEERAYWNRKQEALAYDDYPHEYGEKILMSGVVWQALEDYKLQAIRSSQDYFNNHVEGVAQDTARCEAAANQVQNSVTIAVESANTAVASKNSATASAQEASASAASAATSATNAAESIAIAAASARAAANSASEAASSAAAAAASATEAAASATAAEASAQNSASNATAAADSALDAAGSVATAAASALTGYITNPDLI